MTQDALTLRYKLYDALMELSTTAVHIAYTADSEDSNIGFLRSAKIDSIQLKEDFLSIFSLLEELEETLDKEIINKSIDKYLK